MQIMDERSLLDPTCELILSLPRVAICLPYALLLLIRNADIVGDFKTMIKTEHGRCPF